jgi:hypothetical protein
MTVEGHDRSTHAHEITANHTVHSTTRMSSSRRFSSFSTKSKSDDSSQNASVDVLSVVTDVLGFLLNVKPVIICFYNIHFIDQTSNEAITRLATSLRSRSLFVFAASPSSEQFDYAMFHSSLHLIKQQPSLKYPDDSQKFSSRCYLQWYSGLRETLLTRRGAGKGGEGGAQFILIDELDDADMRDKIKNAIVVSRLNDTIRNNDKEYESVLDIPKVLKMILQYTGTVCTALAVMLHFADCLSTHPSIDYADCLSPHLLTLLTVCPPIHLLTMLTVCPPIHLLTMLTVCPPIY